jgi:hypothetical protein
MADTQPLTPAEARRLLPREEGREAGALRDLVTLVGMGVPAHNQRGADRVARLSITGRGVHNRRSVEGRDGRQGLELSADVCTTAKLGSVSL